MKKRNRNRAAAPLKISAVLLIASMLLSIVSCSKKAERVREVISADTPFYESKITKLNCGFEKDAKFAYCNYEYLGSDDRNYYIYCDGQYEEPADIDWDTYDYVSYVFNFISVIDKATGELVKKIDLKTIKGYSIFPDIFMYSDSKIIIRSSPRQKSRNEQDKYVVREIFFDLETEKVLDTREVESADGASIQNETRNGNYIILPVVYWNPDSYGGETDKYTVIVIDPDGTETEVEIDEKDFANKTTNIVPLDDKNVLITGKDNKGRTCYKLDLETKKLTQEKAKDYAWFDKEYVNKSFTGKDGKIYMVDSYGISHIDPKEKKIEEVFNFGMSDVNSAIIDFLFNIVECGEDSIVMFGQINRNRLFEANPAENSVLIEFKKAATNPHAGKTVLELYAHQGIDVNTGEAIVRFNETNSKYYIKAADRYDLSKYYEFHSTADGYDEFENEELRMLEGISNELAIDIMNGDGPDILIDAASCGRLCNSNCLADLTPYLGSLDNDTYFTNIIEGAKKDGALYNMPLSFAVTGIYTNEKYAGKSGVGFTLDEYDKYLDETLNGKDCIRYGQAYYFNLLFNSMSDKFIVNNKADFSGEEFAKMAEFVKDNVREKGVTLDEINNSDEWDYVWMGNHVERCSGYGRFFSLKSEVPTGTTILGTPSIDGKGPMYKLESSAAVSSTALDVAACAEFVKILLSEDIQTNIALEDRFVINRNAFKTGAEAALKYYNEGGANCNGGFGVVDGKKVTKKDFDTIDKLIASCSNADFSDASINIILAEEMPAYFLGQKKLDQVIRIAQDRVQKVLDER